MRPLRWLDDRVLWLRDQLTPGQRWTAALAVGLVVLVFSVGLPDHVVVRSGRAAAASPNAATGAGAGAAVASSNQGGTQSPSPVLGLATTAAPSGDAGSTATPEPETELVASTPAPAATVVALVRPGNDSLPGRGDADAARVFLAQAPFKAVTVQLTGDNVHDCQAAAVASIALASDGLPPALGDCLAVAGVAVVSFDQLGGRSPGLSTRRGVVANLFDLAAWSRAQRTVAGPVGVVADSTLQGVLDPVLPRLRSAGLAVVATAYVPADASSSTAVADGVRAFAAKGVRTVVLAAPADTRRRWVAQEALLSPGVAHVVADAFDAVVDESYPPTFDGARALTSLRVPWYEAAHGETPAQAVCRKAWEAAVTPPQLLAGTETVRVYGWCEGVALVAAAGESVAALRTVHVTSPLTSDLGPLPDGGWGPSQDAVLQWHASCGCWEPVRDFAPRP